MEQQTITDPCIFTSADSVFFNTYGISFIKSFAYFNPATDIHFHIIDPLDQDIVLLKNLPCNYSVSYTDDSLKLETIKNLKKVLENKTDEFLISGLNSAFRFLKDLTTLDEKLHKLVHGQNYRSGRFIEMNKLWSGKSTILCYDVDTVCTGSFDLENVIEQPQGCLDIKGRFVTSLTAFKNDSQLLRDWGTQLNYYKTNKISFGFMDQNTFISLSKNYQTQSITREYCNHSKGKSFVITGKGSKKFGADFMKAVDKWKI